MHARVRLDGRLGRLPAASPSPARAPGAACPPPLCYLLTAPPPCKQGLRPYLLPPDSPPQRMGLSVIRTWAFNDGLPKQRYTYDQRQLAGLDWLVG